MRHIASLAILVSAVVGCAHIPAPDGYEVRVEDEAVYHPPATQYLSLDPNYDTPSRRPIRSEPELIAWWHKAAEYKCGLKRVVITYGPEFAQILPEYCTMYPGEPDCGLSIFGYFYCSE
jgi:hypothetical protein